MENPNVYQDENGLWYLKEKGTVFCTRTDTYIDGKLVSSKDKLSGLNLFKLLFNRVIRRDGRHKYRL